MSDPLAHLYTMDGVDPTAEPVNPPTTTRSLDEITEDVTPAPEAFSERDADELALLVISRMEAGTLTEADEFELGLREPDAEDQALTPIGKAVMKRLLDRAVFVCGPRPRSR